jgi:Xaa-Pro aminopeptidase
VIKFPHEIELIKRANDISAQAHRAVLEHIRNFNSERQVEGLFLDTCVSAGAHNQAYSIIAGAGPNAAVLHYIANNASFDDSQAVLLDAGAEYECYASDVTRTFPISGHWSVEGKNIYDAVNEMQEQCISRIKPGVHFRDLQILSMTIAARWLLKLGVLHNGSLEEILRAGTIRAFFPHGLGHHIGLEVHDVLGIAIQSKAPNNAANIDMRTFEHTELERYSRDMISELYTTLIDAEVCMNPVLVDSPVLEPGMVVTVEPGLYFSYFALSKVYLRDPQHAKYINKEILLKYMPVGGVRIEDDILVTKKGYTNLTTAPKGDEALRIIRGKPDKGKQRMSMDKLLQQQSEPDVQVRCLADVATKFSIDIKRKSSERIPACAKIHSLTGAFTYEKTLEEAGEVPPDREIMQRVMAASAELASLSKELQTKHSQIWQEAKDGRHRKTYRAKHNWLRGEIKRALDSLDECDWGDVLLRCTQDWYPYSNIDMNASRKHNSSCCGQPISQGAYCVDPSNRAALKQAQKHSYKTLSDGRISCPAPDKEGKICEASLERTHMLRHEGTRIEGDDVSSHAQCPAQQAIISERGSAATTVATIEPQIRSVYMTNTQQSPDTINGETGLESITEPILNVRSRETVPVRIADAGASHTDVVRALYDSDQSHDQACINFKEGDIIEVQERQDSGWWLGLHRPSNRSGWFPENHVQCVVEPLAAGISRMPVRPRNTNVALGADVVDTEIASIRQLVVKERLQTVFSEKLANLIDPSSDASNGIIRTILHALSLAGTAGGACFSGLCMQVKQTHMDIEFSRLPGSGLNKFAKLYEETSKAIEREFSPGHLFYRVPQEEREELFRTRWAGIGVREETSGSLGICGSCKLCSDGFASWDEKWLLNDGADGDDDDLDRE